MVEAVRVHTRYDLSNENGETRRERYERLSKPVPSFEIPREGIYLWDMFYQLTNAIHRIDFNGNYYLMQPSEIFTWMSLTKNLISPTEYDILNAMDVVFCNELNADINAKREKEELKRKQEMEAAKAKSRTRRR